MANSFEMSIIGLYNYRPDIFDDLQIPSTLYKDVLIDNILLECGELEMLYTNPDFLKEAINKWSRSRMHTWDRMNIVLYENYDPFINIKRDEVREITQSRDLEDRGNSTNKVNAWNSTEGVEREHNLVNNVQTGTVTTRETFHVEGDSAITDAQDVARKEMELRAKWDLYSVIINEFKNKFCLYIY